MTEHTELTIISDKAGYWTVRDLIKKWQVKDQTIRTYMSDAGLTPVAKLPGNRGALLFDPEQTEQWYQDNIVAKQAPTTISDAELRLKTANANINELKYKKLLGELIDQTEAVQKFSKLLILIDSKLKEIATLTGPLCASEDDPQVCIKLIDDAVEKARAEIAGCNLEKLLITDFKDEDDEDETG